MRKKNILFCFISLFFMSHFCGKKVFGNNFGGSLVVQNLPNDKQQPNRFLVILTSSMQNTTLVDLITGKEQDFGKFFATFMLMQGITSYQNDLKQLAQDIEQVIADDTSQYTNQLKEIFEFFHLSKQNIEIFKTALQLFSSSYKEQEDQPKPVCYELGHQSAVQSNSVQSDDKIFEDLQPIQDVSVDFPSEFKCTECEKSFTQSRGLTMHIKRTHARERLLKCTQKTPDMCSEAKLFKCIDCPGVFTENIDLMEHCINVHIRCPYCFKICTQSSNLKQHISRIHLDERPFKCTQCDKTFARKSYLNEHIRIHRGEGSFKCMQCDKTFEQSGNFKRHIRTHTGERPFKCTQCDMTFTQNGSLKKHMKTHKPAGSE